MKKTSLHAVGGLPRAGSTLLCNILNQNPRFYASSTSPVSRAIRHVAKSLVEGEEVMSELVRDRTATESRIRSCLRSIADSWHGSDAEVVFDKSRDWNDQLLILSDVFPGAKLIVLVRDLREVAASIEEHHRAFPALDPFHGMRIEGRIEALFSEEGIVGKCLAGLRDLTQRGLPNSHFVRYEDLSSKPIETLQGIYAAIGEPWHEHDLVDVRNVSTDVDALYWNKYPHSGAGAVHPARTGRFRDMIGDEIADAILGHHEWFYSKFYGADGL